MVTSAELTSAAELIEEILAHLQVTKDALESAQAWLERWGQHVGKCRGGEVCSCGLYAVQNEVRIALNGLAAED